MTTLILRNAASGAALAIPADSIAVNVAAGGDVTLTLDGEALGVLLQSAAELVPARQSEAASSKVAHDWWQAAKRAGIDRPMAYLSPNIPAGYDTVLGYLVKHNPEALALIQDPAVDTQRDGFWLTRRTRLYGKEPAKVTAPTVLRSQGIETVNAYPVELLELRLG